MDLKQIKPKLIGSGDKRAVSPVIGVVLMVAVTVILAAVIAAAVMGMGDGLGDTAPTTNAEVSTNSDWDPSNPGTGANTHAAVYVSHTTGDEIEFGDLRIVVRDTDGASLATLEYDGTDTFTSADDPEIDVTGLDMFDAGTTLNIVGEEDGVLGGESALTIQVVHTPSDTTVTDSTVEF